MKIFYNERGKYGEYFELQDVEDFPKMKNIKGIFAMDVSFEENFNVNYSINFNYSLENVIDGSYGFYQNRGLESFNSNLSKLENGYHMFHDCRNLTSFSSDLPNLTNGWNMFCGCYALSTITIPDLSRLTKGSWMFNGCHNLTSFSSNLSSLTNGEAMFAACENLTSFSSNLGSLKGGYGMFHSCKLDAESLRYIANNINNLVEKGYDRNIDEHWQYELLGKTDTIYKSYRGRIDIDYDESVSQDVIIYCGNKLIDKGWIVYFNSTLYEYTTVGSPYDVSEANGYIPDAYKNGSDSWNKVVLTPNMDVLKISIVNEEGEMLNDE